MFIRNRIRRNLPERGHLVHPHWEHEYRSSPLGHSRISSFTCRASIQSQPRTSANTQAAGDQTYQRTWESVGSDRRSVGRLNPIIDVEWLKVGRCSVAEHHHDGVELAVRFNMAQRREYFVRAPDAVSFNGKVLAGAAEL